MYLEYDEQSIKNHRLIGWQIFMNSYLQIHRPVLLMGEIGTAKTAIMSSYLKQLDPNIYVCCCILNTSSPMKASSQSLF